MEGGKQEESSAQRRERLLALRSSSAAAASSPSAAPHPPPPAADAWDLPVRDLMDDAVAAAPRPPPRFDYYTNPASAFASSSAASHKRKVAESPHPAPPYGSGNYGSGYPPPHQHHMAPPPIHSPSPLSHDSPGGSPWRSPMQFQAPMSGYRGPPPGTPQPWSPHSGAPQRWSPHSGTPPPWNPHSGAPPPWSPHSAPPSQGPYPHPPSYGPRNYNPGQGGGRLNYGPRGSPYSSYGRGRGQNNNNYPGSRGRGGSGTQNNSGQQDGRVRYNKSMTDDPWRDLQPIVGNIMIPRDGSKSWLPESLRAKKDTSDRGQVKPPSGLSLAEYLDLSFNEASNDT